MCSLSCNSQQSTLVCELVTTHALKSDYHRSLDTMMSCHKYALLPGVYIRSHMYVVHTCTWVSIPGQRLLKLVLIGLSVFKHRHVLAGE